MDFRNKIISERNLLDKNIVLEKSKRIQGLLRNYAPFKASNKVMAYFEIGNEVRISPLLNDNKVFYLPKIVNSEIVPVKFEGFDDLKENKFRIKEPSGEGIDKSELELCLVPGICFDIKGNRMGYDRGFYDRFLVDFKGLKIGVCYSFQLADEVPKESHDIPVDVVVTEEKIYENKRQGNRR